MKHALGILALFVISAVVAYALLEVGFRMGKFFGRIDCQVQIQELIK